VVVDVQHLSIWEQVVVVALSSLAGQFAPDSAHLSQNL
jgi:hypothetical protein